MKWDIFYNEDNAKPYQSIKNWHKDIAHLIIPTIIMVAFVIAIYLYFSF
ncbi:hypothetical protein [Polaribacter butkevichii]|nr:hypothetical protein [Polaribacter butkevichii]